MAELTEHRKKLRIAKITLTKHVTTMEAALQRSDVSETELDALISSFHSKASTVTEANMKVMELSEDEELERIAQEDEDYMAAKNRVCYTAGEKLKKLKAASNASSLPNIPAHGLDDDDDAMSTRSEGGTKQDAKLPKLMLPEFSGDILKWKTFEASFKTNVHANQKLSDSSKFSYLLGQLKGEALETVENFDVDGASYPHAWALLEKRFGQPGPIKLKHITALLTMDAPKPGKGPAYIKSLYSMHNQVSSHLRALSSLGIQSEDYQTVMCPLIVHKFPESIILEWSRVCEGKESDMEFTLEFLLKEIRRLERAVDIRAALGRTESQHKPEKPRIPTAAALYSGSSGTVEIPTFSTGPLGASGNPTKCGICKKTNHQVYHCFKFRQADVKKRRDLVRDNKLCFKCLGNHRMASCQKRCRKCGSNHHAFLCMAHMAGYSSQTDSTPSQYGSAPPAMGRAPQYGNPQNFQTGYNTSQGQNQHTQVNPQGSQNPSRAQGGSMNPFTGQQYQPPQVNPQQTVNTFSRAQVASNAPSNGSQQVAMTTVNVSRSTLLQTATVRVRGQNGKVVSVTLMFDSGADRSYVSGDLVRLVQPQEIGQQVISISSFAGERGSKPTLRSVYQLELFDHSDQVIKLKTVSIPRICPRIQCKSVPNVVLDAFRHLPMADSYDQDREINVSILIGLDFYWHLIDPSIFIRQYDLVAQKTIFGFVLSGQIDTDHVSGPTTSLLCIENISESVVSRFMDLETLGITGKETSERVLERNSVLRKFNETLEYSKVLQRYQVSLPFKSDEHRVSLVNNYALAEKRLLHLHTSKLNKDPLLEKDYYQILYDYIDQGIASRIPEDEISTPNPVFYMPHRPHLKLNATSSKIRPVFDCSAKSHNGKSLNDMLSTGPSMNPEISVVLIRFRRWPVALSGDVKQAFLQLYVTPLERDVHRFLLKEGNNIVHCRFNRVPFGNTSSPFLLNATVRFHILSNFPDTPIRKDLLENLFVDNYISGADDEESALRKYEAVCNMLGSASLKLDKWTSNARSVTNQFTTHQVDSECPRILGLKWISNVEEQLDSLGFEGFFCVGDPVPNTKRAVLAILAKIFDPLGLVSPYILQGKLLFQKIWRAGLDWNDPLTEELATEFEEWQKSGQCLSNLYVDRPYFPEQAWRPIEDTVELHCFGDASELAYGACVYLRVLLEGNYKVSLVCSRTRVAPIKKLSLPRLELLASVVCARLAEFVRSALNLKPSAIRCYTDSTVSLAWIKSDPMRYKTFVGNRISDIQTLVPPSQWMHVPGRHNPADCASRGLSGEDLMSNSMWLNGPDWLRQYTTYPYSNAKTSHNVDVSLEEKPVTCLISVNVSPIFIFERHSSLMKIINIVAWVHRFINNCLCHRSRRTKGPLTSQEINLAKVRVWRTLQQQIYGQEISQLQQGRPLHKSSQIGKLNPVLDSDGLLRVFTRLMYAELPPDMKFPIILPYSHTTILLVRFQHVLLKHAGIETLLTSLRDTFWIIGARRIAKYVIKYCVFCQRHDSQPFSEVAAPLPADRVRQAPPFARIGLDMAGPLYIRNSNHKYYIFLITCCVTRAIHLEFTPSLNLTDTLLGFRKFAARRGVPEVIYSDNAPTFQAMPRKLAELYGPHAPSWNNIAPRSAHQGGWWERLVRSVKLALRKTLGNSMLSLKELVVTLYEVEAAINTRPITKLPVNPDEFGPLTPAHFLRGHSRDSRLTDHDLSDISALQLAELFSRRNVALDKFWKVWRNNYIANLPPVVRNFKEGGSPIELGDIVLLRDEDTKRQKWPLGRVVFLHPGRDGRVRNVEVKMENNTLTRSIQRLHRLEVQPQSESAINNYNVDFRDCEPQGTLNNYNVDIRDCENQSAMNNHNVNIRDCENQGTVPLNESYNDFLGFEPPNDFLGF